ncbi:Helicase POLQ-like [Chionoecetes opilio]|uniref:Helicase POLQ-like n=1 Tax=Chionoecetes opilio TaxID=41210 RepID=A0A8J4YNQ3_CHIOP|nr:Helicase POLQ-like [Chionoecetes opilio]
MSDQKRRQNSSRFKKNFSGNVKFTVAQRLYNDLLEARDRLSVNTYLHLIHLVIPYENVHTVQINPTVFNKAHSMLGVEELKLANALRIHEGVIARMMSGKKIKNVAEEVLKRFYSAMKLQVMWCKQGVWEASVQLGCERGELQQLVNATTAFASCVSHFCAGRAKMMYKAGLKTPQDVAKCEPRKLMQAVTHLSYTSALQIINSAKPPLRSGKARKSSIGGHRGGAQLSRGGHQENGGGGLLVPLT